MNACGAERRCLYGSFTGARKVSLDSFRRIPGLLVIGLLTYLVLPTGVGGARVDPSTGRVRILYIGDGWGISPVPCYQSDPAFTVVSVPTSELHVGHGVMHFDRPMMKKFVRLYMPRTYESLLDSYDLIILSDANVLLMGGNHLTWMRDSVPDHGLGLVMVGGLESFGAPRSEPWTSLEDVLPVNLIMGGWVYRSFKMRPAIDHAFTSALPWSKMPYFHGSNRISLKQEAILLLKIDIIRYPGLSFRDCGEGRGVAHSADWTSGSGQAGGSDIMRWEYYRDS